MIELEACPSNVDTYGDVGTEGEFVTEATDEEPINALAVAILRRLMRPAVAIKGTVISVNLRISSASTSLRTGSAMTIPLCTQH